MKRMLIVILILLITTPLLATEDYLQQGANHLASGNYRKAIRSYEHAIKMKQDNAEAYKGIGIAYYKTGNNEYYSDPEKLSMALKAFEESLAIKQDAEIHYLRGVIYLSLDNKPAALETYEILKTLDQDKAKLLAPQIDAHKKFFDYHLEKVTRFSTGKGNSENNKTRSANQKATERCPPGYFENTSLGLCEMTPETIAGVKQHQMHIFNDTMRDMDIDNLKSKQMDSESKIRRLENENFINTNNSIYNIQKRRY